MDTDFVTLRLLLVVPAASLRALLRQGAGLASLPVEVTEANSAAAVETHLAGGSDLLVTAQCRRRSGVSSARRRAAARSGR